MPEVFSPRAETVSTASVSEADIRRALLEKSRTSHAPVSVYRLQLHADFPFEAARAVAPYLADLGVAAVYSSPFFQAVPGSLHGYNVTDPNRVNPELGGDEAHAAFCEALAERGLEQVIDVVPNHMGILGNNNRLWLDVLENGPGSQWAHFFDVDWDPIKPELRDKVLLPVLGDLYGRVLDSGEIALRFGNGEFTVAYYDHLFPVAPHTYPDILEHGVGELETRLGAEHPDLLEYLSVVTAFRKLPGVSERDPRAVAERTREKEIAKQRLSTLTGRSNEIRAFVESRTALFCGAKGNARSFDLLGALLDRQAYRLAHWTVASEEINYRRFFNINELAALRMEDERVFRHCHELALRLVREGKVQGLRIDHPDGLYDPSAYFSNLQKRFLVEWAVDRFAPVDRSAPEERARVEAAASAIVSSDEFRGATPLYVVVEKILDRTEALPSEWAVHGTVGYDFLNALGGLFVKRENREAFDGLYEEFIEHKIDFDELVYDKKKSFAMLYMSSEVNALGHRLDRISEKSRYYRDFTRNNLTLAIRETIDCFPVYRTYVSPADVRPSERDEKYVLRAIEEAKRRTPALNPAIYDFLRDVLLMRLGADVDDEEKALYRDFTLRFQQLTGPIMAKGLEDTAFYVAHRLASLNEVGGDPSHFGTTIEEFHRQNAERLEKWPLGMITTSTHDTKRSQDVRMRLHALSEIPVEWRESVFRWSARNASLKTPVDGMPQPRRNTEYLIYQTLLGAWPDSTPEALSPAFRERIWEAILKSVREAKVHTNWVSPNAGYEAAVESFTRGILDPERSADFLADFESFALRVSRFGKMNSLSALVLKMASPGVMDTYQGEEVWDYRLVDPDNRYAVDFGRRASLLARVRRETSVSDADQAVRRMAAAPEDGRIKMLMVSKGLELRRRNPELFLAGDYVPLETRGKYGSRVVSFLRRRDGKTALAATGRFFSDFDGDWGDTAIVLPAARDARFRDAFSGRAASAAGDVLRAADAFGPLHATLLIDFEP